MEVWDAYNSDLEIIDGLTLIRGKENEIPHGVYHLVCDILVKHTDGSFLLMKRHPEKTNGGMWEATAGGSALKGESPMQCAVRELYEETGISSEKLYEIGRIVSEDTHSIFVEHLCITDCDKTDIRLQQGETCDFIWQNLNEMIDMGDELLRPREAQFLPELNKLIQH